MQTTLHRALRQTMGIAALTVVLLSASCGGGGGDSSTPGTPSSQITMKGTVAAGNPLAGVTLIIKDAAGHSVTATTAADGTYGLDATGLTPPFLAQVSTASGAKMYSVSAENNTTTVVNVTPLTDLIIRSWYEVQAVDVDTAFGAPATYPAPSPQAVDVIATVVRNMVQLWLDQAGVDSANFNLISTPFTADGAGFDLVLDRTTVNPATGAVVISDGTTTQSSTLTAQAGSVEVSTTTTGPNGSSSSAVTTVVPVQTAQQSALDAITANLNNFASVVNTKGAALTAADVLPFFDQGLLNEGLNRDQFAASVVSEFAGLTMSFNVLGIKALNTDAGTAEVLFKVTRSLGSQSQTETADFFFKNTGGTWLLFGDQRIASVSILAEMRTNQGSFTGDNGPDVNVDVQPLVGAATGVTVSGGIWSGATLTHSGTVIDVVNRDHFFINSGILTQLPAAGTPITVTLATANGPVSYTIPLNAWTNEAVSITNLTGTLAASVIGTTQTVNWTLPKTFPIARVKLNVQAFTGDQTQPGTTECQVDGPVLGITATTGQIAIPTTCPGGLPVVQVNINLNVTGVNGERETVIYQFL